ncbi:threonine/serine dehydratase [Aestuariivirga litoralis]|uniref:Threonine/serine dehydratase n=2 Tax=Aestuariivirga litoralis TaxID=2650924 RepID=A0A2W2B4X6_9HYPH|nr:threonine/serine dehydratase [Aestuariivirga litoralis]
MPAHRLRLENVLRAATVIDPVFRNSPQFNCEPLSEALACFLTLKLETANPIRSFKGRGAGYLVASRVADGSLKGRRLVGASAGNWGQALAYACRSHGIPLTLFAATTANALKVARMKALGAEMVLTGHDFDAAKQAGEAHARATGGLWVADGLDPEAAEGAATIALELLAGPERPDVLAVPLGNGALLTGIARWAKAAHPGIEVIGVQAKGADAMEKSWRSGTLVFPPSVATIADGIGVRVPIREAVEDMQHLVDEVLLVEDADIITAMRSLFRTAGLMAEPSGAAGVAAIQAYPARFKGRRVATVLCGSNLTAEQVKAWLM